MKKLTKLFLVLGVITFTTNTFAGEMGLKMANFNLASPTAKIKKSSGSGGIEKGDIQIDANFNLGSHGFVAGSFNGGAGFNLGSFGISFRPGFTLNVDGAVHPYASVGGYFGFDGGIGSQRGTYQIGIGARGVFHIYQLISDKAGTKVDPENQDFYFPFHMGGFVNFGGGTGTGGGFGVGGGLGVRYYFTDLIGINAEVGWLEMSVCKLGVAFKL